MYRKDFMRFVVKTIILSLPVMIGFALMVFFAGRILYGQGEALLGQSETRQIDVEASLIKSHLAAAVADLRYVAKSATMAEWLEAPTPEHFRELEHDFIYLVKEKAVYLQVRLLGTDGMELVRVDVGTGGHAHLRPKGDLQSKRDRAYFSDAMKLADKEVLVSPLDLNEEHGKVEVPFRPTIRIATPLFAAEGERRGVLVFNLRGEVILGGLRAMLGESGSWEFLLVNGAGYWLVGPSPDHEWGFQIPSRATMTLPHRYPRAWEALRSRPSGRILTDNGLFVFTSIFPEQIIGKPAARGGNEDRLRRDRWILLGHLPNSEVTKSFAAQMAPLYAAFVLGSLIILAYALILAMVHNRLQQARRKEHHKSIALGESLMNLQELIEINDRNIVELRESNSRLESVLHAASRVSIIATDGAGMITLFNRGAENMLGYSAEEMVGKHTPEFFHVREEVVRRGKELAGEVGHDVAGFGVFVETAIHGGGDSREWTYRRKDGSRITVELAVTAIRNDVDGITGFLGIAVDVTERNRVRQELESNQARLNSIVETASDGIFTVDTSGTITSVNRAGAATFGYVPEELVGQKVNLLMAEPHRTLHDRYLERFLQSRQGSIIGVNGREVLGMHRNGGEFPLELAVNEVHVGSEHFFTGILRDITKRKQVELTLHQANEALVRKQRALDDDLNAAAVIQRSLLPPRNPRVRGFAMDWLFLPSAHIGGDVFNILPLPGGQLGLYLIDVSGHGPAAAMVTVSISQVLQAGSEFVEKDNAPLAPDEVLRRVDKAFPFDRFDRFSTMFYMTYSPAARTLRYSSAGHPPPLLARHGRAVMRLDKGGTVIGMGEPVPFVSEEVAVEPGDVLLLYTDGCTEHDNHAGEQYGVSRLAGALAERIDLEPVKILEGLRDELNRFAEQAKPEDDISLVCLKFT
ncbi:MAG: PAS domain S-box protein [Pseudodesulfovibrio sp.]